MRGGARRSGAKAYSLYVERPTEGANEADGPFSAAGWIADCTAYLRERGLGTIEATAEVQEVLGPAIPQAAQKGPDARRRPKVGREGVLFVR